MDVLRDIKIDWWRVLEICLEGVAESFRRSEKIPSKHPLRCTVCQSHPVNHVRSERILCRQCGVSYQPSSISNESGDYFAGEVVLNLRKRCNPYL